MFQADKPDGGIDFANLVTNNDGLKPRDMTPDRELEPMAKLKIEDCWRSNEDCSL
jgi:hypothetical protein